MTDGEKFIKCKVIAKFLQMEEFDENGEPKIEMKVDLVGNEYPEVVEKLYETGEIVYIPESRMKRLERSVVAVKEPVVVSTVVVDAETAATEKTVSDLIPKTVPDEDDDEDDDPEDDDDDEDYED